MAIPSNAQEIPIVGDVSSAKISSDLNGKTFIIQFDWNYRDSSWYATLRDSATNDLWNGQKVFPGVPLFGRLKSDSRPDGWIIPLTKDGSTEKPGRDELGVGNRVKIYFIPFTS